MKNTENEAVYTAPPPIVFGFTVLDFVALLFRGLL